MEEISHEITSNIISIDGFADSRVAQGMLALIIEVSISVCMRDDLDLNILAHTMPSRDLAIDSVLRIF